MAFTMTEARRSFSYTEHKIKYRVNWMTQSVAISNKAADLSFKDIPYGDYAAILLHDENDNGKIDHFLGLPSEPLGYTDNWRLSFTSGMPNFQKLKFTFNEAKAEQIIYITFKKN